MTREKMLQLLADLPYTLIWPGSWYDVGFTEREIWVNSKGYGYIMCDELTGYWEGNGISAQKWETLKPKIIDQSVSYSDIHGTEIEELLSCMNYAMDYLEEDNRMLNSVLTGLLNLKQGACGYIYALHKEEGIQYYDSESDFRADFERDWVDVEWAKMDDVLLAEWIDRLSFDGDGKLTEWVKFHGLSEAK